MISRFLEGAVKPRIGRNAVFQHIEGNLIHHHNSYTAGQEREEGCAMPRQYRYREIFEGDVFYEEQTSSQEKEIVLRTASTAENNKGSRIKVVRRLHTATVYPNNNFTVTVATFEPKERGDKDTMRLTKYRSPRLAQMLGLVRSEIPTFILYEELADGVEFTSRYPEDGIVYQYLQYTREVAIQTLRADKTRTFSVSRWFSDWTFNLKTNAWHYDVVAASIDSLEGETISSPIPLPRGTQPQLDAKDIETHFEKSFGDVFYLYASLGCTCGLVDLSDLVFHGLLTFGAVIKDGNEIVAHFPSTPAPEWHIEDRGQLGAKYSTKGVAKLHSSIPLLIEIVPSRVDFQFFNTHQPHLKLYFSLRLPLKERIRLRAAYLSQHPLGASESTYLIDEIGFALVGNLSHTPTSAYLFVPPLRGEYVNEMHCIPHPLPDPIFYWASDPKGKEMIPEDKWERYSIPKLEVQKSVGSHWFRGEYGRLRQHLIEMNYGSDMKRYTRDKGYPELVMGDPHDRKTEALEDSDEGEPSHAVSHLTSPSLFSLVNVPTESEACEEQPSIAFCLAKRLGLQTNTNAKTVFQTKSKSRRVSSESKTDNPDEWDWVDSKDL
ncbi:hypothetical protein PQX77_021665 [Marasmius sp. AFHP31]|nr:hypothetical protein PQX77_021665 [Marasmius sp. AFHP31]